MTASYISSDQADALLDVLVVDYYLGLGNDSEDPTAECDGTDYARVAVSVSTDMGAYADYSEDAVVVGRKSSTTVLVDFGTVGAGGWGTISWLQIYDAATAGNLLEAAPLTTAQVTVAGNQVTVPIGNLSIIVKGGASS